ncbi:MULTISPECIES: sensor histidine kinase [Paenibacillus]|uniref:sensor histidine kinase n=1 Tax=Paenibacillus TaxID=44249 RepID=UPI00119D715A|nr:MULTISPECIES: HAMP domain-containing sensor histidine kinase [Paenibacillus]MCM2996957.1 HAMP domain-containing histidine kinase [Paenibacillus cellulositrophicus]GIO62808.1 two-component sensor histidine kinase [Paenibacillus cineris]
MLITIAILLIINFIAGIYLIHRHFRLRLELRQLIRATREIRTGNLNMRYRGVTSNRDLSDLGGELNRMVDYFQRTYERTRFLEEERKRMIANISHDLRTPLTALLGYLEALRCDGTLSAKERERFLGIASEKGSVLLALLQDFFELARLESDESEPDLRRMDLAESVREALAGFYPQFVKAGITPTIEIPETPVYGMADASFLTRILNNLLSNALRYGSEGGEIGVKVRDEAGEVWIDIWDRGRGIPATDLPHIFERLYTGEASRNTALQGTGLGLTIAKNLVEKLGGRITAASSPNIKTVISFSVRQGQ